MDNKTTTSMADAITKAAATATKGPETATAAIAAAAPIFIDDAAQTMDLKAEANDNGLTADQLFSACVFRLTDKEVFASDDGKRYSRKVADVKVELAGSGFYLNGGISEVQSTHETTPHLEFAWLYSRASRTSAISFLEGGSKKAEMAAWKDKALTEYEAFCKLNNVVPGQPKKIEHSHIVAGVSLIGTAAAKS